MSNSKEFEIEEGDVFGPDYVSKTDAEIKDLAIRLYKGEIFTSNHINNPSLIPQIFMVLPFMNGFSKKMLILNDAYLFYEEMSQAGPASLNGYPCFFSMRYLDRNDANRLFDKYDEIVKVMENV